MTENENIAEVVQALMDALPDSRHKTEEGDYVECWDWAWNELNDDAQDEVKNARQLGRELLDRLKT